MPWGMHQAQHLMHEMVARAHLDDLNRQANAAGPLQEAAAGPKRPSIFRRALRRIRGGGD